MASSLETYGNLDLYEGLWWNRDLIVDPLSKRGWRDDAHHRIDLIFDTLHDLVSTDVVIEEVRL